MTSFRLFPFPPLLLLFRCAIIIRNRFDSASTVACIRSDRILDFENGCTSRRESAGEFQN